MRAGTTPKTGQAVGRPRPVVAGDIEWHGCVVATALATATAGGSAGKAVRTPAEREDSVSTRPTQRGHRSAWSESCRSGSARPSIPPARHGGGPRMAPGSERGMWFPYLLVEVSEGRSANERQLPGGRALGTRSRAGGRADLGRRWRRSVLWEKEMVERRTDVKRRQNT